MKNLKSYLENTQVNFTSQEENFFEQELLKLTIAERTSFNGYLFYSNLYPTIKASHKTIANEKISDSSQFRATKKFKSINLITRIKTHHRRPLTTIIHPIIYNLSFRKRMSKYFPLFKYLPETLLFSLSISNSVFNTRIAKESIDSPFNILSSKYIKSEMSVVNDKEPMCSYKNTYKEASHTTNRKLGEQQMLQLEISPVLSKISLELKLTDEQITRLSEYTDSLLTHAYKYAKDKSTPYTYLLKVCVSEASNPRFKQSVSAKGKEHEYKKKPSTELTDDKLQELADYYGFDELDKKVSIFEKCVALAKQTYEKNPTLQNQKWVEDYESGLQRWIKIFNFAIELDKCKANEVKQPNTHQDKNLSTNSNVVDILQNKENEIDYTQFEEDFTSLGF